MYDVKDSPCLGFLLGPKQKQLCHCKENCLFTEPRLLSFHSPTITEVAQAVDHDNNAGTPALSTKNLPKKAL